MGIHATATRTRRALLVLVTSLLVYGSLESNQDYSLSLVTVPAISEGCLSFVDLALALARCSDNKPSNNRLGEVAVLVGATVSATLLYAQLDDQIDTHFTLIAAPFTAGLVLTVMLQTVKACKWLKQTTFEPVPPCGSTSEASCFDSWLNYASKIPLDRYHYQACGQAAAAAGAALALMLLGAKLDGGDYSWGAVIGPIAAVQFLFLGVGMSGFIIHECVSPNIWTAFSRGWNNKVAFTLPPLTVSEFLLMINLQDLDRHQSLSLAWSTVFTPFWVFNSVWLLSETLCSCCCMDDGKGVAEFEPDDEQERLRESPEPPAMGKADLAVVI